MLKLKEDQSCPKSTQSRFYLRRDVFKDPKKLPFIWANFNRNLDTKNFKNRPIWSHCYLFLPVPTSIVCTLHNHLSFGWPLRRFMHLWPPAQEVAHQGEVSRWEESGLMDQVKIYSYRLKMSCLNEALNETVKNLWSRKATQISN